MRKFAALVSVGALSLSMAACGSSSSGSGASSAPFVIGFVSDLSGPLAVYGEYDSAFLNAAVKAQNAKGGVAGHQIKVVSVDIAAAGQNAVSGAQQLITRYHPDAITGMVLSQDCASLSPLAEKNKIPLVCNSADASELEPVHPYTFAGLKIEATEAKPAVDFATKNLGIASGAKYATFVAASGGAQGFAAQVDKLASAAGLKKTAAEVIPLDATSVDTQISNVVAAKPDVVFIEPVGPQIAPLVQGLRAAGIKAPVIIVDSSLGLDGFDNLADPGFYSLAPASFVTDDLAAKSPGVAQIQKVLDAGGMSGTKDQNQSLGAEAILPALGIIKGLQLCGSGCTPDKLGPALEKVTLDYGGFVKGYGWSANNHLPVNYVNVYSYDPATKGPKVDTSGLPVQPLSDLKD